MDETKRIDQLEEEVARLRDEVERLSIDAVTGIPGRGVLDRELATSFARTNRTDRPMAVAILDLDHFKAVNDDFGHLIGDEILHLVAKTAEGFVRDADAIGRFGGEEFVMIFNDADPAGVATACEKVRAAVESLNHSDFPAVTVSIGWAMQTGDDASASDILKRADAALYIAKDGGRNVVKEI